MHKPLSTSGRLVALTVWTITLQIGGLAAATAAQGTPDGVTSSTVAVSAELDSAAVPAEIATTTTLPPVRPTVPTTTVPPAPKVTARAAAPATPAPAQAPSPPPPSQSPLQRVQAAFSASIPRAWQAAIPVRFEIISGVTSWGHPNGLIQIGTYHADGPSARLRMVVAHEFGHLIAFRYGSGAYNGAAPKGWPAYGSNPAEAWADCVSQAFTGVVDPSHGLPPCSGSSLSWTRQWLAEGPPGR
ncbi:MAG: hypothetical protein ACJ739_02580 [Acidimicrobiales bacterium]